MRFLLNSFIKYRDSIAVASFFAGVPLIYFLRDGIGLATNNMLFSIGLMFLPFLLTIPFKDLKYFESPNKVTFPLLCWFTLYMFAYFYLKDRFFFVGSFIREFQYFILILIGAVCVLFLRNSSIDKSFIYISIVLTFIGCLALLYYIAKNPFYVLGQRASFSYGEESVGNPHINSKAAYFGVILGVLSLKHYKTIKLGLVIPSLLILISFIVLFLTQTMLAFLAVFAFGAAFLFFNFSFQNSIGFFRLFFSKWYILLIVLLGSVFFSYQFSKNKKLLDPAIHYVESRTKSITESIFGDSKKNKNVSVKKTGDDSANTRIEHIGGTFERLAESIEEGNYHYVLFGHGYKSIYLDIPHLEMLDSHGLVGLIFFTILFLRMLLMAAREMRNPESIGTEFLAYAFIYYVFANFTSGQMLDYTRFLSFFIFCRFLKK